MAKNLELLDRVMDFVRMNPERWYQGSWFGLGAEEEIMENASVETLSDITSPDGLLGDNWCGTTGCIAGHTLALCGYRPVITVSKTGSAYLNAYAVVRVGDLFTTGEDDDAREMLGAMPVAKKAEELLGLTHHEGDLLFSATNSLEAIEHLVKAWNNGVDTSDWHDAWGPDDERDLMPGPENG